MQWYFVDGNVAKEAVHWDKPIDIEIINKLRMEMCEYLHLFKSAIEAENRGEELVNLKVVMRGDNNKYSGPKAGIRSFDVVVPWGKRTRDFRDLINTGQIDEVEIIHEDNPENLHLHYKFKCVIIFSRSKNCLGNS